MNTHLIALVPAAGTGSRAGGRDGLPKQYRRLAGQPMLRRTVRALLAEPRIAQVRVAVVAGDPWVADALAGLPRTVWRPCGGATRADTVRQALLDAALEEGDWVLVHDAARPGLPPDALGRLIDTCWERGQGGLLALPVADTLKQGVPDQGVPRVAATVSRNGLWQAQTPQMFPAGELRRALLACRDDPSVTDEASAVERDCVSGGEPLLVMGSPANDKLTWPEDFRRHETWLQGRSATLRIGQGHDLHRLTEGRELRIGGVAIPFAKGLQGHSDGDVLLHAVTDAVLGAAGLGDIGRHFPDTDPRWAGADSRIFLKEAVRLVALEGWRVANLDATIHAEAPKIAPHAGAMVRNLAELLGVALGCVNVKAKTNEGLGYLGRGEGIAASVVVMLAAGDPEDVGSGQ